MTQILDLQNIKTALEFHQYVRTKLQFSDYYGQNYYGQNWDAFYDCISEIILEQNAYVVEVINTDKNVSYLTELVEVLDSLSQDYKCFSYRFWL
jgi:RNAse (barnase) inhibitor barstar